MTLDKLVRERIEAALTTKRAAQVEWLAKLVRFRSLRGEEAPCQEWLASEFAARGFAVDKFALADVKMDGLPGRAPPGECNEATSLTVVAAHRPSAPTGRSLILQGHIDVVPAGPQDMWRDPPFEPVIRDGWMNGRGCGDMKCGVAAMVFAVDALFDAGLEPAADLFLETVTEEESTGNGALSTLVRGYLADAALIPEPTGHTLNRAHVGVMWFRLVVRGEPVHVARSEKGTNAILSAFHVIQAVQRLTRNWNDRVRNHPVYAPIKDPLKFNPGIIRGGDWASSTPAWCEVDCRIGLMLGWSLADCRAEVEACVAEAAQTDSFLRDSPPKVIWNGFQADGFLLDAGGEAEQVLASAHQAVFGEPMEEKLGTGVTDQRFYTNYYGIPALCYGPRCEGAHAFNERADLESLHRTTLAIALFVAEWCGVRPR